MDAKIKNLVEATRPYNMMSPVLIFNIGYFIDGPTQKIRTDYFVAIAVIVLALAYATIQNDIEDRAIDQVNAPEKPITSGALTLKEAEQFTTILLAGLLVIGLYRFPAHIVVVPMLGLIWLYNKSPFYLSRKPYASIILALLYSTIPILYGYLLASDQANYVHVSALVGSWLLIRTSIALLKDFKDAKGDRLHGKRTFYVVFGYYYTSLLSLLCFCIGSVGALWLLFTYRQAHWLFVLPILFAINQLWLRLRLIKTKDREKLSRIFQRIFFGQNYSDLAYLLCLILLK